MDVYHLPKIVKKELERLLTFCECKPYDCLVETEECIERLIEAIDESVHKGYVVFKN